MNGEHREPRSRLDVLRRHIGLTVAGVVVLVLAITLAAYAFFLNSQLGNLSRFDSRLAADDRAPAPTGEAAQAQNILVLGTDKGKGGKTIEQELADGKWSTGAFRSDTIMLLHVPREQEAAYLVSIPRDSYVSIPGNGKDKINAAFSIGGPDLTVRTVEELTGVYVNHVAMVDWAGFKELTHAIGGVQVTVPETFTDPETGTWEEGTYTLEGQRALAYVRTRHGLARGDFDRINRQQNFLRAAMRKANSTGVLANPVKLTNLLQAVTSATTVDSTWSTGEIRDLALNLRGLNPRDIKYLTAPTEGIEELDDVGSVVLLDDKECRALWDALRADDVQGYLKEYGGDRLPGSKKVR
jgi:LCP family protein required for cell wall assembly